ncbi:septum formation family protein, partial [Mycobacterium avium]|uniref:septum formation family protein n=1 Tax=Mycobacterium avium TaxID=1764 RepID=UPI00373FD39F
MGHAAEQRQGAAADQRPAPGAAARHSRGAAVDAAHPVAGSGAVAVDHSKIWPPGTCLGIDSATNQPTDVPVDCAAPHAMEVTGTVNLAEKFPGALPAEPDQDAFIKDSCTKMTDAYLAPVKLRTTTLTLIYPTVPLASWTAGSREVACSIGATLGNGGWATLLNSAKGQLLINGQPPVPPPDIPEERLSMPPIPLQAPAQSPSTQSGSAAAPEMPPNNQHLPGPNTQQQVFKGKVADGAQSKIWPTGPGLGIDSATNQPTDVPVDCAAPHAMEVTGTVNLAEKFPGALPAEPDQDAFIKDSCTKMTDAYLAPVKLRTTTLTLIYPTVPLASWTAGSREVACSIGATLGNGGWATLLNSAKGQLLINGQPPVPPPDIPE